MCPSVRLVNGGNSEFVLVIIIFYHRAKLEVVGFALNALDIMAFTSEECVLNNVVVDVIEDSHEETVDHDAECMCWNLIFKLVFLFLLHHKPLRSSSNTSSQDAEENFNISDSVILFESHFFEEIDNCVVYGLFQLEWIILIYTYWCDWLYIDE